MTEGDIAELFIRAAETEAKLPEVNGLRENFGRYTLPWVHDLGDINGRRREFGDQLLPGDDPLGDWSKSASRVLAEWGKRPTTRQIENWERCMDIMRSFLTDEGQRRSLWAWARAQAGTLTRPGRRSRISFARWCRDVEKIAEITGHRRKNRVIASLFAGMHGKPDLHCKNHAEGVLPDTQEISHIFATVEGDRAVYDAKRVYSWRDDPSFSKSTGMSLREWRNAKRRQKQAA